MSKENKRVERLEERRKKQEQHKLRKEDPWKADRWFEFVELFDPEKIVPIRMKEDMGHRMFMMGDLNDTVVIQVPSNISPSVVSDTLQALGRRGVRAIAFTNDVSFCKLRMCSPEEEELLTTADEDKDGIVKIKWPPRQTAEEATAGSKDVVLSKDGEIEGAVRDYEAREDQGDTNEEEVPAYDFELPSERFDREKREQGDPDSEH